MNVKRKPLAHAYFLFQANRANSTLNGELEAVIPKVSVVQLLRLRTNPWQLHKAKCLPPTKVCKASYFSMKILVFAEPGNIFLTTAKLVRVLCL